MAKDSITKKLRGLFLTGSRSSSQKHNETDGQDSIGPGEKTFKENPDNAELISFGFEDIKTVGRYEIIQKLGQGNTGVVFLGSDPYIKRSVAIKISQPTSVNARRRFFLEAQSAGRLNHPSIVSIYDAGMYRNSCYITMEYIEGADLKKYCKKDSLLPLNKVAEIIFSVCNALDYAHRNGVVHKDIKPANIMIDKMGAIKITDFGIAQTTERTAEIGFFGTPSYMSPEQLKDEVVGSESDIFSLGCVLYELLTGERAFSGDKVFSIIYKIINEEPVSITDLRPDLPEILQKITKRALSKDRSERYQTCMDFAYDLRVALRGLTGTLDKIKDVGDYIHSVPFFHNFTKKQVQELISACTIVKVQKAKVIVAQGEIDDTFYVILSGKARVMKDDQQIASIGTGQCFGEMSFIGGQARIATVLASTNCVLLKISAALLDRSPESIQLVFYKSFATTLVRRMSV